MQSAYAIFKVVELSKLARLHFVDEEKIKNRTNENYTYKISLLKLNPLYHFDESKHTT